MRASLSSVWRSAYLLASLVACQGEGQADVYVPAPGCETTVTVSTDRPVVRVGEPLALHARRTNGAFMRVPRKGLPPDAQWWTRPPPPREDDVAGNVQWTVTPAGRTSFGLTPELHRTAIFSSPGTYRLQATSAVWCAPPGGARSNEIAIDVLAP